MYHPGVTFNPYAPPDDSQQNADEGSDAIAGPAQEWTIEEVLRLGWDRVKADWPVLVFAPLLAMGVGQVMGMGGGQIVQRMHLSPLSKEALGINFGVSFLAMFVHTYFLGGLLRIMLRAARGESRLSKCGFAGECIRLRRFNPATVAVSERERNGKAGNEGRLTPVIDTPHTAACCHIRDRIGTCHPDACLSSIALGSGKLLVEGRCLGRECPWNRHIDPRWH